MTPKIPLPTDNIYKFYATFGLALIIAAIAAGVYVAEKYNRLIQEYELMLDDNPLGVRPHSMRLIEAGATSDEVMTALHNEIFGTLNTLRLLQEAKNKEYFYLSLLGAILVVGLMLSCYGFTRWHRKIQPLHDRYLELQIEALKNEIEKNRTSL